MKAKKTLLLMLAVAPLFANAESVPAPAIEQGDSWTYVETLETAPNGWRQTHDEIDVLRTTPEHIYITSRQAGSTQAASELVTGADWSRSRNVNGIETTVNRPLSFPLSTGKSWEVKYTEAHPNPKHDSETFDSRYKVVGPETVDVPAGKFNAIKIEAEGEWTAKMAPMHTASGATISNGSGATIVMNTRNVAPVPATGRLYKAFWYVPEIGRWVKSVEEYYNGNGVRTQRMSSELESFKRGAQQ